MFSKGFFDLVDELGAEFATDPPGQPALAWAAFRQYDGEHRGNFQIFGDHLDAASRHVRDGTVARQAGPELDLREAFALATFASASILQHVDPSPCSIMVQPSFQPLLKKNYWNLLSGTARNVSVLYGLLLPSS